MSGGSDPGPTDPPPGDSTSLPTGSQYVSYTTLNPSGSLSFQQVLNAVPSGKILTLPAGTYTIGSNFPSSTFYACVVVPSTCAGIIGQGADVTILQMAPNSSTAKSASEVPDFDSNPCKLMVIGHGNFTLKNLQVRGTPQGHYYQGVQFYPNGGPNAYMTGIVVDSCKFINSAPGFSGFPPGETFQIDVNWCDGIQILNCEIDGRNPTTLVPESASPIGFNNTKNSYVQDTYTHHGVASCVTWWRCTNIHTLRLTSELTSSGPGNYMGPGLNHEQVDGTVLHESPTLISGYGTTGLHGTRNSMHFAYLNNDGTHPGAISFTMTNVSHDSGPANSALSAMMWTKIPVTITKNGTTLTKITSSQLPANAATQWVDYA